jgi:hypothetical protein
MMLVPVVASAAEVSKSAEIIFDPPHLEQVQKGSEITYKFERQVSDEKLAGPAYTDEIRLGVFKVAADGKRDVSLQVFTGDRARAPCPRAPLRLATRVRGFGVRGIHKP